MNKSYVIGILLFSILSGCIILYDSIICLWILTIIIGITLLFALIISPLITEKNINLIYDNDSVKNIIETQYIKMCKSKKNKYVRLYFYVIYVLILLKGYIVLPVMYIIMELLSYRFSHIILKVYNEKNKNNE